MRQASAPVYSFSPMSVGAPQRETNPGPSLCGLWFLPQQLNRTPTAPLPLPWSQYADGTLVDIDIIQTTHLGANVQNARHNAFSLNRELVDDLRDVIVNKQRAYQRNSRLQVRPPPPPPPPHHTSHVHDHNYLSIASWNPPSKTPRSSVIRSLAELHC